jgi:hypothetical protein
MNDLAQLAARNISRLEDDFQSFINCKPDTEKTVIVEFSEWVRDTCRLTINTKIHVICDVIKNGKYKNIYDAAEEYSSLLKVTEDALLRAWLGRYYERRMAFDREFKDGDKFIYAALTAGGGGVRDYDPYCLQLVEQFYSTVNTIAYLPGDSITICFTAAGKFDEAKTSEMITPHSHRHLLAACRNGSAAIVSPKSDWPRLLNEKTSYIEAIFIGDVTLEQIHKVQVLKSEYDRLMSLILRTIGRRLEVAEHTLVDSFRQILTASRDRIIELECVT